MRCRTSEGLSAVGVVGESWGCKAHCPERVAEVVCYRVCLTPLWPQGRRRGQRSGCFARINPQAISVRYGEGIVLRGEVGWNLRLCCVVGWIRWAMAPLTGTCCRCLFSGSSRGPLAEITEIPSLPNAAGPIFALHYVAIASMQRTKVHRYYLAVTPTAFRKKPRKAHSIDDRDSFRLVCMSIMGKTSASAASLAWVEIRTWSTPNTSRRFSLLTCWLGTGNPSVWLSGRNVASPAWVWST